MAPVDPEVILDLPDAEVCCSNLCNYINSKLRFIFFFKEKLDFLVSDGNYDSFQ